MSGWQPFPYENEPYHYAGSALESAWRELHGGDRAYFPTRESLQELIERHPGSVPEDFDGDVGALAETLQSAWRAFHAGEFERAAVLGGSCGALGHSVASKATGIYANYLEPVEERQRALFLGAARTAEAAMQALPEDPNSWYFHAFNLGRYSQSVSVAAALREGIGGKIQQSLKRTLELEPRHAEAHTAFGLYHAEIIDKVGRMIGGMTYGASADRAVEHFERALELTPESPAAHIEYGNGLYLLFGDLRIDDITDFYIAASELQPRDAMEKLDVERAAAELE